VCAEASHRMRERGSWLVFVVLAVAAATVVPAASTSAHEPGPPVRPAPKPPAGIPFGPNELVAALWRRPYTGTKIRLAPQTAVTTLRALRARRMRVTVKLVGPQGNYKNEDGSFSLERWKAVIDRFRGIDFARYVRDGTIVGHQIVSEAKAPQQWGKTVIANDVLDEMARYSKSIWPQMPTLVRADALELERHAKGPGKRWRDWTWRYLDAASSRYLARKQDPAAWFRKEQASADRQGLALAVGLNVLSGGDGSSGVRSPTKPGAWTMSADEVRRYGSLAIEETKGCAFEIWQYLAAADYFTRSEIASALGELNALAARRPGRPCTARPR
jgi:hypothetical protein